MTQSGRRVRKRTLLIALSLIVLMLALAATWHWTPLGDLARSGLITDWLHDAAHSPWMPLFVAIAFVGASLVLFPNTVLSLAVILALGPVTGTAYAFGGSLLAALVGHTIGRWGGRHIEKLRIHSVDRISAQLRRGGFLQVLALRMLPVAPFSATNILAGAARVRLLPFAAATAVGIAPYILTFAVFGRQGRRLLSNPTFEDAALTLGIVAVAALVVWRTRARLNRQ